MPRWLKKHKRFTQHLGVLIVAVIIAIVTLFICYRYDFLANTRIEEIYFLILVATLMLAYIAYIEFHRSHNLMKNEALLYISNRWGNTEIIKARMIIHELFITEYRTNDLGYPDALAAIGAHIDTMSKSSGDRGKEFVYLLNLMDYLETLGYLYVRGDLDSDDIKNTCGNNTIFFYGIFNQYIENRQKHEPTDFKNFVTLYTDLVDNEAKKNQK